MSGGPIVVVGDLLLDIDVHGHADRLAPDAPVPVLDIDDEVRRPGGAGLAATLAARYGERPVVLVTPVADDDRGRDLVALLAERGVEVAALRLDGPTTVKRRVLGQDGRPMLRLDEGGGTATGPVPLAATRALRGAGAVLVADYGQGATAVPELREALAATAAPVVWDPHPRGAAPLPGLDLVTPNRDEARRLAADQVAGDDLRAVSARARLLRERWDAGGVAVTLGRQGALLLADGPPLVVPAPAGDAGPVDPCGAGDCFAATVALALADGATTAEAVGAGVAAASGFVRSGGVGARPSPTRPSGALGLDAAVRCVERVRARGGTVVATGGCFDLLHAGHVATLRAARDLGDCLVVLVNSDASVRRLKGDTRPVVPEADRAQVLAALDCVDAVVVFDDDTPVPLLRRLEPAVWAKGGDYSGTDLPETPVLAEWGGAVVLLPYLEGRSTTGLVHRVVAAAG
ncbi:D-glycero-beta-D-manno-heptose 1-phosphate adenylyltransferase [Nocardioides sp. BYT-33-1]|uniref:D-glycero-beta-D-manno-heptose 1-phosphate adenylyltransferase n=1 Tax=Nocardioides sp. BYT-33-1 TaxID=3416952 RepID=UPI003F52D222